MSAECVLHDANQYFAGNYECWAVEDEADYSNLTYFAGTV